MSDIEITAAAMREAYGRHCGEIWVPWEKAAPEKRAAWITCASIVPPLLEKARADALEEAAKKATSFLVGDPSAGVPLRNPMAHEVATAIRSLANNHNERGR